ncbi:MAG TPA: glycerophosphodiester phosphodiesterase [Gemmatimonadales bacterium]
MSAALVIAHRGAAAYEVENSLAAFRASAPLGADAVELDVHATADGELIVHHDETLDGVHRISHLVAAKTRSHRLANGEQVPTLAEALAAIAPRLEVWVELKSLGPQWDHKLLAALDAGPNPTGYAAHSFDHRIVRRLGEQRPGLKRGVLSASYLIRPVAAMEDAGATVLWQEHQVVDRALVVTVHSAGGRVIAWTVDDAERMRVLLEMGVDGICTNRPDVARAVVGRRAA